MSRSCAGTVLSRSCPGHVQVLSRFCPGLVQVLSRSCPGRVQVVSRSCPGRVQVMSKSCPSVASKCHAQVSCPGVMSRSCVGHVQVMSDPPRSCPGRVQVVSRSCPSSCPGPARSCPGFVKVASKSCLISRSCSGLLRPILSRPGLSRSRHVRVYNVQVCHVGLSCLISHVQVSRARPGILPGLWCRQVVSRRRSCPCLCSVLVVSCSCLGRVQVTSRSCPGVMSSSCPGCHVQVLCPGVMSRCHVQVSCPGVMSRCRVQVSCPSVVYEHPGGRTEFGGIEDPASTFCSHNHFSQMPRQRFANCERLSRS